MRAFLIATFVLFAFASVSARAQAPVLDPLLVARANSGKADAQYEIGQIYVALDDAKAAAWFRKAADQGNAAAQTELAFFIRQVVG